MKYFNYFFFAALVSLASTAFAMNGDGDIDQKHDESKQETEKPKEECFMCCEAINKKITLPCNANNKNASDHSFHAPCIKKCIQAQVNDGIDGFCPLCTTKIPKDIGKKILAIDYSKKSSSPKAPDVLVVNIDELRREIEEQARQNQASEKQMSTLKNRLVKIMLYAGLAGIGLWNLLSPI